MMGNDFRIGDSARKARVIETIPKVGFRLVAPVTPVGPEPVATTKKMPVPPGTRIITRLTP